MQTSRRTVQQRPGFGILESIVTLGVVSLVLIVALAMVNITRLQEDAEHRTIARQLLVQESEALRSASFADLHNRTATPFIEVAYGAGSWSVAQPASPQSAPNTYRVAQVTTVARAVAPTGPLSDGTYEASIRVDAASPGGWSVGFYLRYHDSANYYLLRVRETGMAFLRNVEGTETSLWSNSASFAEGVWYRLSVAASDGSFTVSVNGVAQSPLFSDPTFSHGALVLMAGDGATAEFDDVSFAGSGSAAWSFDAGSEVVGNVARGWRRAGPEALPSGATSVTITDAVNGFTDLKAVALTVSWFARGATRTLSNTLYINQYSVRP